MKESFESFLMTNLRPINFEKLTDGTERVQVNKKRFKKFKNYDSRKR